MTNNPIAERLESLLDARGEDLAALARGTGISYHTLFNLKRREVAKLSAQNADLCAAYLGTTARFILTGEAPPSADRVALLAAIYESLDETGKREMEDFAAFLRQKRLRIAE